MAWAVDRCRPRLINQDYWAFRAIFEELHRFLVAEAAGLRGGSMLDFGSGSSPYRPALEATGVKLVPADINPPTPEILAIDPASGRIDIPDGSFDYVLSTQVLEHVPDVQQYLREALRLLKPGGKILLSTHGTWYLHRFPTDMRRWTIDGLRYEHELAGFVIDEVTPRIGMMATATHMRLVAVHGLLTRTKILAPLRVVSNFIFNLRMGVEEAFTSQAGREKVQQLIVIRGHKPG